MPNFPKNEHFLPPDTHKYVYLCAFTFSTYAKYSKKLSLYPLIRMRTCAYQEVTNVLFSENLTRFVFLKHPPWNSPFCLITVEMIRIFILRETLGDLIVIEFKLENYFKTTFCVLATTFGINNFVKLKLYNPHGVQTSNIAVADEISPPHYYALKILPHK